MIVITYAKQKTCHTGFLKLQDHDKENIDLLLFIKKTNTGEQKAEGEVPLCFEEIVTREGHRMLPLNFHIAV